MSLINGLASLERLGSVRTYVGMLHAGNMKTWSDFIQFRDCEKYLSGYRIELCSMQASNLEMKIYMQYAETLFRVALVQADSV